MQFDAQVLGIVIGFMILANRLVAALITPLFEKLNIDKFYIMYISWFIAGVLAFLGKVNLFGAVFADPIIGQILTAIVAGGGGNLLHDISDQKTSILIANVPDKVEELPE